MTTAIILVCAISALCLIALCSGANGDREQ